jgi:hypothetical protein
MPTILVEVMRSSVLAVRASCEWAQQRIHNGYTFFHLFIQPLDLTFLIP